MMYSVTQLAMDCFFSCAIHPIRVESTLVRILPIGLSYALIMTVVIDTKYNKLCSGSVFRMSEVGLGWTQLKSTKSFVSSILQCEDWIWYKWPIQGFETLLSFTFISWQHTSFLTLLQFNIESFRDTTTICTVPLLCCTRSCFVTNSIWIVKIFIVQPTQLCVENDMKG